MELFHAAYSRNADWAVANLTTWLVYLSAFMVLANVAVVITAFVVQRRQFANDRRAIDTKLAKLHIAALRSAKNAIVIYDGIFNRSHDGFDTSSRSDMLGRLRVVIRFLDYYLDQQISEENIVYALVSTLSLIERARADVEAVPSEFGDRVRFGDIQLMYKHRKNFRDGIEKIVDAAFNTPAGDVEL